MVAAARQAFGRLDIAVNNAGVGNPNHAKLADIEEQDWRRLIGINLDGVYLSMKAEIPAMLQSGGGAIVNMASVNGGGGDPWWPPPISPPNMAWSGSLRLRPWITRKAAYASMP